MVRRRLLRSGLASLVLLVALLLPGITFAGGMAVTLDSPPADVEAGKPLTIGFLIRSAHEDRSLQRGLTPFIIANSLTTDDVVTATATEEGAEGHYVVAMTFPSAGEWRWQIQPFGKQEDYSLALPGPLQVRAAGAHSASQAAPASMRPVKALDSFFEDRTLTIPAGTTITWTNVGKLPHTVRANNNAFASGNIDPGARYSFTFAKPGTYMYYCEYHGGQTGGGMDGTIVVVAAALPAGAAQPAVVVQPESAALPATGTDSTIPGVAVLVVALIAAVLGLGLRWRDSRSPR